MSDSPKKCGTYIGGQAVLEGVMMRGKTGMATAVRDDSGTIQVEATKFRRGKFPKFFALPFIRGIVNLIDSLISGTTVLMRSAEVYAGESEEEEPSAFEKWLAERFNMDVMTVISTISMIVGFGISILMFVFLPYLFSTLIAMPFGLEQKSLLFNVIEGLFRIAIFVGYIALTSLLKDIRRTYMYHGAEHKTITCYESGLPLTVENVKGCKRVHDRCGTTFLFFVMALSILVFSIANSLTPFEFESGAITFLVRFVLKMLLLPLVAGVSYELLKVLSVTDNPWVYPLKAPGLALQHLTTREPDDDMIECAIAAFQKVLEMDADPLAPESSFAIGGTLSEVMEHVDKLFTRAGIEGDDCKWIFSMQLGIPMSELQSQASRIVSADEARSIYRIVNERLTGRPLWYIIGDTSFCGYTIKVDERVLIPRSETETLVEETLKVLTGGDVVLDLCTGSGAIAVAVKKMCPYPITVVASDISDDALSLAKENAKENGANIEFVHSDLFSEIKGKFNVIVSNPPYIPTNEIDDLQVEVRKFEPRLALDGGEDGLDIYRKIANTCRACMREQGILLMEVGMGEASAVAELLEQQGAQCTIICDLAGVERIVKAQF